MANLTSTGNVNLTSSTNWSPAQIPVDGDSLNINAGHTLTLDKDITLVNFTTQSSTATRILKSGTNRTITATGRFYYQGNAGGTNPNDSDANHLWQVYSGSLTVIGKHQVDPWAGNDMNIFAVNGATLNLYAASSSDILFERLSANFNNLTGFVRATNAVLNTSGLIVWQYYLGLIAEAAALFRLIAGVTWTHNHTGTMTWNGRQQICRVDNSSTLSIAGDINYTGTIDQVRWWNLRGASVNATFNGHHLQSGTLSTFGTGIFMDATGASALNLIGTFFAVLNNSQPKPIGFIGVGNGTLNYINQNITVPAERFLAIGSNSAVNISGLDLTVYGKGSMGGLGTYTVDANTRVTIMPGGQFLAAPVANIPVIVPPDPAPTLPPVNNVTKDVVYGYAASPLTGTGLIVDPAILAAAVQAGVGLAAPNLDTQLAGLSSDIDNITVDNAAIADAVRSELGLTGTLDSAFDAIPTVDESAIATSVFQLLVGSGVARYALPTDDGTVEAIRYVDFDLDITTVATAADSKFVLTIGCEGELTPYLIADSETGLVSLQRTTEITAAWASVERISSTLVRVYISANAMKNVPSAEFLIELRELTTDGKVKLRYERPFVVRSGVGRTIE